MDEDEDVKGGGGQVEEGSLQGVVAFESIISDDVWRYIWSFCREKRGRGKLVRRRTQRNRRQGFVIRLPN